MPVRLMIIASAFLVLSSCYTVLIHHHTESENESENCELCSGKDSKRYLQNANRIDSEFGAELPGYEGWYEYYESPAPWWFHFREPATENETAASDTEYYTGRNYGRRRAVTTGETHNSATGNNPTGSPASSHGGSASAGATGTSDGGAVSRSAAQNGSTEKSEPQSETSTDKSKDTKREYGRRSTIKKND